MKYKLLLMGTNYAAIDDFFGKMENDFELLTTTPITNDLKTHIRYFQPDAVIYCMHQETRNSISNLVTLKQEVLGNKIPFIIIGNPEECEICSKMAANIVDYSLVKPLTAAVIRSQIMYYLNHIYMERSLETPIRTLEPVSTEPTPVLQEETTPAYTYQPKKQKQIPRGEKLHILVVDDDVRMIKTLKLFLDDSYQVATAVSGAIAMRYLESKPADLILLDYEMPEMNGPEVLEQIRSHPGLADIPVVFLTGTSERQKIAKAISMKPQGYLLKPIERVSLITKLHEILG